MLVVRSRARTRPGDFYTEQRYTCTQPISSRHPHASSSIARELLCSIINTTTPTVANCGKMCTLVNIYDNVILHGEYIRSDYVTRQVFVCACVCAECIVC